MPLFDHNFDKGICFLLFGLYVWVCVGVYVCVCVCVCVCVDMYDTFSIKLKCDHNLTAWLYMTTSLKACVQVLFLCYDHFDLSHIKKHITKCDLHNIHTRKLFPIAVTYVLC